MKTYNGTCRECGAAFTARSAKARFCSTTHEKAFNNRRMTRGALLYDLFMASRYNPENMSATELRSIYQRIGMRFRDEDKAQRGGRASWLNVAATLDKLAVVDLNPGQNFEGTMAIGRKTNALR